jgi:hypothetical protein
LTTLAVATPVATEPITALVVAVRGCAPVAAPLAAST